MRVGGALARVPAAVIAGAPVAAFALVVAGLAWRSRGWALVHDAPLMHYVAWRIAQGAVPYRDVFDMNFPGVYLLHLAIVTLLGPGDGAWRAFDLAWMALGSLTIAAFAATWGMAAALGGALLFAAHHLAGGAWNAGQRDFLLCPFLVAGALGVARWLEGRGGLATLAAAGLALGAGLTIKPQAVVLVAALAIVVALAARQRGHALAALATHGAGLALPVLAVTAWVAALGGLSAWREIVVEYLIPLYSRLGRPPRWGFYRWEIWLPVAAVILVSLVIAARSRRLGARHAVAMIGLAYGVAHYVGQGKGWEYHVYPLAAFASVLAFAELPALVRARHWVGAVGVAGALVLAAALFADKGAGAADAAWIQAAERRVDALVADMRPRLRAGDTVQVLDTTDGGIHALLRLGVRQPTRFLYGFHFFHDVDTPIVQRLRAELIRGLDAHPPRLIVVFDRGWPAGGPERVQRFPELAARLARLAPAARGDGYVIYAQRDGS